MNSLRDVWLVLMLACSIVGVIVFICRRIFKWTCGNKSPNVKWVENFNMDIERALGGESAVSVALASADIMLPLVIEISKKMSEMCNSGCSAESISECVSKSLKERFSAQICFAVARYCKMFGESLRRIKDDREFRAWIVASKFHKQPEQFTHQVLLAALAKVEVDKSYSA